ncbi:MAG: CheR family methyltransferase [Candidatus Eremiobacterota bacterium]
MAFTYFFRDYHTLNLTVQNVVKYASGKSNIRIWDAGCAMGPEPYSLAIIFSENMGHFAFRNLKIDATDIDESNLFEKIISEGEYHEEPLQRIPPEIFAKYFDRSSKPEHYKINEKIRRSVVFQKHNLLSLKPAGSDYSLIVCKNVLLHFQQSERIEVIKMFHKSLAPGGYFATEQTQKLPEELSSLFTQVVSDAQLFKKV